MNLAKLAILTLIFLATAGNTQAESSDREKAVQLAKCTADCRALRALDPNPDWANLASASITDFSIYAFRLYGGADRDILKYSQKREGMLVDLYEKEGRRALIENARAAFQSCADIYWQLIKQSQR